MALINKPNTWSDLTIFMVSFTSSIEIINVVTPEPNIFLWIAASVPHAIVVNSNGIKTLLASGLSRFFIKGNIVLRNGPKSLPKNPPVCPILGYWDFDNFSSETICKNFTY